MIRVGHFLFRKLISSGFSTASFTTAFEADLAATQQKLYRRASMFKTPSEVDMTKLKNELKNLREQLKTETQKRMLMEKERDFKAKELEKYVLHQTFSSRSKN